MAIDISRHALLHLAFKQISDYQDIFINLCESCIVLFDSMHKLAATAKLKGALFRLHIEYRTYAVGVRLTAENAKFAKKTIENLSVLCALCG